jgi:hypothetical protein
MVMRFVHRTRVIRTLACGFALLVIAGGGAAAPSQDPKNAAMWYGKSIAAWQAFKQSNPQQAELIANYAGDPSQPITPEIRAALTSVQGAIGEFKKGSQQEHCDFSLDYSQGFELMLSHLGEMRGIARAIRADAAVRLADGDASGAAAELASMYKTSGHFGDDRVLISSLVGQAVFSLADGGVQMGLDSAAFNAADAAALLGGAEQLGVNDPFQYVEAVGMEQEIALATFEKYRGAEGAKLLGEMLGEPGLADKLSGLDDAGFDAELARYDDMMTRVNAAFGMTDKDAAMAEMKKIASEIESGGMGVLATVMAPAFGKLLERKFAGEEMIADRIATLGKLASGELRPEEVANAALWYLRAIEMWEALPQDTRTKILSVDMRQDAAAPPPEVLAALVEVQPIVDVVREASIKRRCDFAVFVKRRGMPVVAPHYAPGMHELLEVLQTDATRLQTSSDASGAVDRYAIVLRASAHLGGDANLAVCRTAHVHFNATLDELEAASKSGALDLQSPAASALADAAGRVSRKDPFGYLAALQKTRDDIVSRIRSNTLQPTEDEVARRGQQLMLLRHFNADQTMFVLVMLDERMRRMIADPPLQPEGQTWEPDDITLPESIERLRGVIDPDAEAGVRATFEEIGPRIAGDDWEIFLGREAPPIARLNQGLTRARGDLRRATSLLMLPDEPPVEEAKPAQP